MRITACLEKIFLKITNMNLETATMVTEFALMGYIEDCLGREDEEAQQEIQEAWTLILKKLGAPHYTENDDD